MRFPWRLLARRARRRGALHRLRAHHSILARDPSRRGWPEGPRSAAAIGLRVDRQPASGCRRACLAADRRRLYHATGWTDTHMRRCSWRVCGSSPARWAPSTRWSWPASVRAADPRSLQMRARTARPASAVSRLDADRVRGRPHDGRSPRVRRDHDDLSDDRDAVGGAIARAHVRDDYARYKQQVRWRIIPFVYAVIKLHGSNDRGRRDQRPKTSYYP